MVICLFTENDTESPEQLKSRNGFFHLSILISFYYVWMITHAVNLFLIIIPGRVLVHKGD